MEFLGDLELQAVFIESDNSEDALVATDMTGKKPRDYNYTHMVLSMRYTVPDIRTHTSVSQLNSRFFLFSVNVDTKESPCAKKKTRG